jgi:hypothetical protein
MTFDVRDRMGEWEAQREEWLANRNIDDPDSEDDETDAEEEQLLQARAARIIAMSSENTHNQGAAGLNRKERRAAAKAAKKAAKKTGKKDASVK